MLSLMLWPCGQSTLPPCNSPESFWFSTQCLIWSKKFRYSLVVYHLHRHSGNSGWKINGTLIYCRPNWKMTGINGSLGKAVLFDWLGRFNRFGLVPIYTFSAFGTSSRLFATYFSRSFKSQNGRNAYCSN